jgi:hypothetical protein
MRSLAGADNTGRALLFCYASFSALRLHSYLIARRSNRYLFELIRLELEKLLPVFFSECALTPNKT